MNLTLTSIRFEGLNEPSPHIRVQLLIKVGSRGSISVLSAALREISICGVISGLTYPAILCEPGTRVNQFRNNEEFILTADLPVDKRFIDSIEEKRKSGDANITVQALVQVCDVRKVLEESVLSFPKFAGVAFEGSAPIRATIGQSDWLKVINSTGLVSKMTIEFDSDGV